MSRYSVWTTIRLKSSTLDRLNARKQEMIQEYYRGHQSRTPVDAGKLSLDELVNWLLDERERHRARAARARGAGKPQDGPADETAPGPDDAPDSV